MRTLYGANAPTAAEGHPGAPMPEPDQVPRAPRPRSAE
jgi:hypothetical protein